LSVKIDFSSIAVVGFILVFSYATKVTAASKLIIPVGFRNNSKPKTLKASIMPFSSQT
jgi:hypothetical protein